MTSIAFKIERDYLIGTNVIVKAYVDNGNCCEGGVNYDNCKKKAGCNTKLDELPNKNGRQFSKDVSVTGAFYYVKSSNGERRRRLLRNTLKGC